MLQNKVTMSFDKPTSCGSCKVLFNSFEKFSRRRVHNCLLSHTAAISGKRKGYSNWYRAEQTSSVYHHTKFETNRPSLSKRKSELKFSFFGGSFFFLPVCLSVCLPACLISVCLSVRPSLLINFPQSPT